MPKLTYKYYMLGLLTFVGAFNYVDRTVISLLLELIKQDLQLSDSQLGLLTGFAFSLFYGVAGIPIARWADRGNRNIIVTVTTGLWSAMVVLCGLAGNYTQLLLARVGVAVGEAGCLPTAQSLIADYFNRAERPHAMAIYWLCSPIAVIIGYLGAGWLAELMGWRMTFVILGIPGILLALLAKLTLREPRLKQTRPLDIEHPSFKVVLATLWQQNTFRYITIGFCVSYFFSAGTGIWLPTFFIRSHGMTIGELATWLTLAVGVGGLIGTYLGGFLASRYAAGKEGLQLKVVGFLNAFVGLLFIMVYLSSNKYIALALYTAAMIFLHMCSAPAFAVIQSVIDERMRSTALAIKFLLANLIGLGLGPLATGVLSDFLAPRFGNDSLRYSLILFQPGLLWMMYYYWKAGNNVEADIRNVSLSSTSRPNLPAVDDETAKPSNGTTTV